MADTQTLPEVDKKETKMIRKVSVELVPLTQELARKISTLPALPGERDKKPSRLKFFKNHLRDGTFGSPTWSTVVIRGTNQELRADGQHTSTVFSEYPAEQAPKNLKVTIQKFEIDSIAEDGAALFDMFDNPQSARSNTDAMGVHRAHFEDLMKLQSSFLVKVAKGIDYYLKELPEGETGGVRRYVSRQHGLYFQDQEYRDFSIWLFQWEKAKYAWMIKKPGLVGEMLADYKASSTVATEFWGLVFTNSHPDVTNETRELGEWLKDKSKKPRVRQDELRKQARKIWNRFRRLVEAERKPESVPAKPVAGQAAPEQSQPRSGSL